MSMGRLEGCLLENGSPEGVIENISAKLFVERWKELIGDTPAAMLDSRREMLILLIESLPAVGLTPMGNLLTPSRFDAI